MANTITVEINEAPFQIDYKENLTVAFKMFEEIKMDLDQETTEELVEELKRVDEMTQDILHMVELVNFNAVEGYNFSKMLQVVRRARRKIKDRMEERRTMKAIIKQYDAFLKQVNAPICNYNNKLTVQDKRSYRLRQLTELEGYVKLIDKQKNKVSQVQKVMI